MPEQSDQPWWRGSGALAGITAACTVLLAVASFMPAQAASDSDDSYAISANALTDANFFYEQGFAALTEDMQAGGEPLDRDCLLGLFSDESAEFCDFDPEDVRALSEEDPAIRAANDAQALADDSLEVGLAKSAESVAYQSALVVLALGLALSAWASLAGEAGAVRTIFSLSSLVALLTGLVRILTI